MNDFNVRADSVNVEELMERIRTRIREKRGVDYTEEEVQRIANVKLEQFLEPDAVRSDLVQRSRRKSPSAPMPVLPPLPPRPAFPRAEVPEFPLLPPLPPPEALGPLPPPLDVDYQFNPDVLYASSRGFVGRMLVLIRRMLNPVLKLFINPTPVAHALHVQSLLNTERLSPSVHRELDRLHAVYGRFHAQVERTYEVLEQIDKCRIGVRLDRYQTELERIHDQFERMYGESERFRQKFTVREEVESLSYEMLNNLVVEVTKLGIDTKNLKMRVESLGSRLDFDERRARALEGVVQYRSPAAAPPRPPAPRPAAPMPVDRTGMSPAGPGAGPASTPGSAPGQPQPPDDPTAARSRRRRRRGRRRGGGGGQPEQPGQTGGQAASPGDMPAESHEADAEPPDSSPDTPDQ